MVWDLVANGQAGFVPQFVQRGSSVRSLPSWPPGVGMTRLPLSARSLRDTGVAFVPLRGESADVVVAWSMTANVLE
jgi:hypothetical protein